MKLTKRVLSMVLAIAMLLTVATFPAVATTPATEGRTGPETIDLSMATNIANANMGPYVFSRPTNDFYVGDSLEVPDNATLSAALVVSSKTIAYIEVMVVHEDGTKSTRWIAIEEDAKNAGTYNISKFYTAETCNGERTYSPLPLTKSGKCAFIFGKAYDSTGTKIGDNYWRAYNAYYLSTYADTEGRTDPFYIYTYQYQGTRFFIDVKPTPTDDVYGTQAPETPAGLADTAAAITPNYTVETSTSLIHGGYTNPSTAKWESSRVYPDYYKGDLSGYKYYYQKADTTGTTGFINVTEDVKIDFGAKYYIESFDLPNNYYYGSGAMTYDVWGSDADVAPEDNAEGWYLISTDQSMGKASPTVNVGKVVRHVRVDIRDTSDKNFWGILNVAFTGTVTNIVGAKVPEPVTVTVTFVDKTGAASDDELVVTSSDGLVEVPSKYQDTATTIFEFYYDEECTTNKIADITAEVFTENKTVYVKAVERPAGFTVTILDSADTSKELYKGSTVDSKVDTANVTIKTILKEYTLYTDENCTAGNEVDLTATLGSDTTYYAKKRVTVAPPSTGEYEGKEYGFIVSEYIEEGKVITNAKKGQIPFTLPDTTYYVNDSITFPENFFTENQIVYDTEGKIVTGVTLNVYKYGGDGTKTEFASFARGLDTSYQFTTEGTYVITTGSFYYDDGESEYKYIEDDAGYRLATIEVKTPPTEVAPATIPSVTTPGTVGTLAPTTANVRSMSRTDFKSSAITKTDFKSATATISGYTNTIVPGIILDLEFDFTNASYIESVSWTQNYDTFIYEADVYGSVNGTDWYLLGDDVTVGEAKNVSAWTGNTVITVQVGGVARFVRIDNLKFCGNQFGTLSAASAQGYALESTDYSEDATPVITLPNGTKYAINSTYGLVRTESETVNGVSVDIAYPTLPVAYPVSEEENYLVTGWQMLYSDGSYKDVSLAQLEQTPVTELGNLVPVATAVPFDVTDLTATGTNASNDTTFDSGDKYINGLFIQGAQIRFADATTGKLAGLRFVNVVNQDVESKLLELQEAGTISNVDHGTLAKGGVDYDLVDLTIKNYNEGGFGINNTGNKIFVRSENLEDKYYKYTLCVTGFVDSQYTLDVYVRPYITFEYEGEIIYLYGEQFKTTYKEVVQEAYDRHLDNTIPLGDADLQYCKDVLGITE